MEKFPRIQVFRHSGNNYPHRCDVFTYLTFPGGEPHVKVDGTVGPVVDVDARLTSFEDVGHLLALTDVLKRGGVHLNDLFVPYFPGGRMDRGAPFTAKIYADILLGIGFDTVTTVDPHSHVTTALGIRERNIFADHNVMRMLPRSYNGIIAPDAGAQHRTEQFIKDRSLRVPIVQCLKNRDPHTGQLSGFAVASEIPVGPLLVVDDICDGGGTFLGLADLFPDNPIDLYVTHGIFSRGTEELLKRYGKVYSTTSFMSAQQLTDMGVIPLALQGQEDKS